MSNTSFRNRALSVIGILLGINCSAAWAVPYGGIEFPEGEISFADVVVAYEPLFGGGPGPFEIPGNDGTIIDPTKALGAPQLTFDEDVALGNGGRITLQFTDNALTGSGTSDHDLHIFELGADVEDTFVEISKDGIAWHGIGKVFGAISSIDIDAFGFGITDLFYFVRLTDDPNEGGTSGATVGADIDAVGAISTVVVSAPEPFTIWLLGFGLAGIGFSRIKKE